MKRKPNVSAKNKPGLITISNFGKPGNEIRKSVSAAKALTLGQEQVQANIRFRPQVVADIMALDTLRLHIQHIAIGEVVATQRLLLTVASARPVVVILTSTVKWGIWIWIVTVDWDAHVNTVPVKLVVKGPESSVVTLVPGP